MHYEMEVRTDSHLKGRRIFMPDHLPRELMPDASAPNIQVSLAVTESSQVAEARQRVTALAHGIGFNETDTGTVALAVTELATNLVKYATNGVLVARVVPQMNGSGIEVLALDTGPGMANVTKCLRDGYSTTGSPGTGLGAILRLSTLSEIYSAEGKGTAVLTQFQPQGARTRRSLAVRRPPATIGTVCVPHVGETVCGDAWAIDQRAGRVRVMVADGLGHGPLAAEAAQEAIGVFRAHPTLAPAALLEVMHPALRRTRGAAVAVAEVDLTAQLVRFAGVGNIAGTVLVPAGRHGLTSLTGLWGTLCQRSKRLRIRGQTRHC